jgi:hypothetical protein
MGGWVGATKKEDREEEAEHIKMLKIDGKRDVVSWIVVSWIAPNRYFLNTLTESADKLSDFTCSTHIRCDIHRIRYCKVVSAPRSCDNNILKLRRGTA